MQTQSMTLPLDQLTRSLKTLLLLQAYSLAIPPTGAQLQKLLLPLQSLSLEQYQSLQQQSSKINLIDTQDLLKLYLAKCKDHMMEYIPEQAVKFLQRYAQNSKHNEIYLNDEHLGIQSAKVLAHIIKNNVINKVFLGQNKLGGKGLSLLKKGNFIWLDVTSNGLRPEEIEEFLHGGMGKNLVGINFKSSMGQFRNKVADAYGFERYLSQSQIIQFLGLSRVNLSLKGLEQVLKGVEKNDSLVQLDVSCNDLGWRTTGLMNKYLKKSKLIDLNIAENNISNLGISDLVLLFVDNPSFLKIFNLADNRVILQMQLTTDGLKQLFSNFNTNESIVKLILDRNNFSDKDVFETITSYFKQNRKIEHISFRRCQLSCNAIDTFVEGLGQNGSIQELDFSENQIKDQGAFYIAQGIQNNKSLKRLYLKKCKIGDEGGKHLAQVWKHNSYLKYMDLHSNMLKDDAAIEIIRAILNNPNIKNLSVNRNLISYKLQQEMLKFLKQNIYIYNKKELEVVGDKVEFLRTFEKQKYSQYEIKKSLTQNYKEKENILELQQKSFDSENNVQQEQIQELEQNLQQTYHSISQMSRNIQNTLQDHNMELNQLQDQKNQIEDETSEIVQKTNQLHNDMANSKKIAQETHTQQKILFAKFQAELESAQQIQAKQETERGIFQRLIKKFQQKIHEMDDKMNPPVKHKK